MGINDDSGRITIEVMVKDFQFINTHPFIIVEIIGAWDNRLAARIGTDVQWALEMDNNRAHHAVRVGERLEFDGTKSIAFGAPITSYRWEFHDGTVVGDSKAEKTYHKPGTYMATGRRRPGSEGR